MCLCVYVSVPVCVRVKYGFTSNIVFPFPFFCNLCRPSRVSFLSRYHLGLKVPDNYSQCFIVVGNERRSWEDGKDLVFDDNLWHWVENHTPQRRIVLFVDFLRDYNNYWINLLSRLVVWLGKFNVKVVDLIRLQNYYHENHIKGMPP